MAPNHLWDKYFKFLRLHMMGLNRFSVPGGFITLEKFTPFENGLMDAKITPALHPDPGPVPTIV